MLIDHKTKRAEVHAEKASGFVWPTITGTGEDLLRKRESTVVVQKIEQWVDAQRESHSPRSLMGKTLTDAHNQRERLRRFLEDPKLALDNNYAE